MIYFEVSTSVTDIVKKNILNSLNSNKRFQSHLISQCLRFSPFQIRAEQTTLYSFEKKMIPYYNLVKLQTHVATNSFKPYDIICIHNMPYNELLSVRIFTQEVIKQFLYADFISVDMIATYKKVFISCPTLLLAKEKILDFIDLRLQNFKFLYGNKILEEFQLNKVRLKTYVETLYKKISIYKMVTFDVSTPILVDAKEYVIQQMSLNSNQWYQPNCKKIKVRYTYANISSNFTVLIATTPIEIGQRFFHTIPTAEQYQLKKRILKKWPIILQIDKKIYVPRVLWYMPVALEAKSYNDKDAASFNAFNFFADKIYNNELSNVKFQITCRLKKHYTMYDYTTKEILPIYNLVKCNKENNIITVEMYHRVNFFE